MLQGFADTLSSCRDTLKTMNCEEELSGGRSLLQIVEKLPDDMKRKWLSLNYEITTAGRSPKLDDIVRFVHMEAEKRADPIFGDILKRNPGKNDQGKGNTNKLKRQSFASSISATKQSQAKQYQCPKCGEVHFLNQCPAFRGLTVPQRLSFVREKKLCQNCFQKGHLGDQCTRNWVCKVPGCGKNITAGSTPHLWSQGTMRLKINRLP